MDHNSNADGLNQNAGTTKSPREGLIETAVKFLKDPKIINTPLAQKQKFLKRKGLTDEEINRACSLAGSYETQVIQAPLLPAPYPQLQLQPMSFFQKVREVLNGVAILSIVGYTLYKFYEKYIAPFLFGKKKKTVEERIEELGKKVTTSVSNLSTNVDTVKIEMTKIRQASDLSTERQLNELKSELASIKGLLLNRKQFPSVASSRLEPPSIPAWQMSSLQAEFDEDVDGEQKQKELEEIGSGSGSSEQEHCTKTSESSLEIIYQKDCDSDSNKTRDDSEKD